jgi:polyhydroxyalkanoate synthesis regulator phasin
MIKRNVYKIDCGNMSTEEARQYVNDMMCFYRNKYGMKPKKETWWGKFLEIFGIAGSFGGFC